MTDLVTVTGASGHIGANLVRALLVDGRRVRAVVVPGDRSTALDGLPVERVTGDLGDPRSLTEAFDGAEAVYNLAGHVTIMPGQEERLARLNVDGVRNVVDACLDRRVKRLVHFSSIQALSPFPIDEVIDETRPLCHELALPPYDRSKALGELEIASGVARGLDAVVVNPTAVFGPFDYRPSQTGRLFLSFCRGTMPAALGAGFNFVDVRDVAAGGMAAERLGSAGARYILGGAWHTIQELAEEVEKVTGMPAPRFQVPFAVARAVAPLAAGWARLLGTEAIFTPFALQALSRYRRVSSERAAEQLGYRPRPLGESVAALVAWFGAAGLLPASEASTTALPSHV